MANQFKVGFGREIITPPLGTLLFGYPRVRPASAVNDDLTVNAIAFEKGKELGVMISADICTISESIVNKIRGVVFAETKVPADSINFSCTHTHSGPAITGMDGWGQPNNEFIDGILIPKTILAVKTALKNLTPATMGVSSGESLVGINRRQYTKDGQVILGQNPFGICDKTMTVMSFKNEEGKVILNVIHYSCHGTSAGAALEITRDWPGHMVDRLEELSGANTVFFNGNCGDMGPRLSNGATTGLTNTLSQMNEISALAAIDAVRIFRQIKNYEEVDFEILKGTVVLPYNKMPSLEEVKASIEKMGDPEKLDCLEIPTYSTLKKIEKLYEDNVEFKTEMKIPQALFTFNKVAFVPIPFEFNKLEGIQK